MGSPLVLPTGGDTLRKGAVLDAWGAWLSQQWDWSWWVTLTFDPAKSLRDGNPEHTAVGWSRSARSWDDWLSATLGDSSGSTTLGDGSIYWVRGREPNPYRYGTHFHALVGGVAPTIRRDDAWRWWFTNHGHARIEPYNPAWGAGRYLSKYVVKELGDITFSDNLATFAKGVN